MMDSLELPYDLIWEGKPEPMSPSQLSLSASAEEILFFDNDFANGKNTPSKNYTFYLSTIIINLQFI